MKRYREDKSPIKISLGIGVYRNAEGKPFLFQAVKQAEFFLAQEGRDKVFFINSKLSGLFAF